MFIFCVMQNRECHHQCTDWFVHLALFVSCSIVADSRCIFITSPISLSLRKSTYSVFFIFRIFYCVVKTPLLFFASNSTYLITSLCSLWMPFPFCCLLVGCIWNNVPSCPIGFPNAFIQFVFNLVYVFSCVELKTATCLFSVVEALLPVSPHLPAPHSNTVYRRSPTHNIFFYFKRKIAMQFLKAKIIP